VNPDHHRCRRSVPEDDLMSSGCSVRSAAPSGRRAVVNCCAHATCIAGLASGSSLTGGSHRGTSPPRFDRPLGSVGASEARQARSAGPAGRPSLARSRWTIGPVVSNGSRHGRGEARTPTNWVNPRRSRHPRSLRPFPNVVAARPCAVDEGEDPEHAMATEIKARGNADRDPRHPHSSTTEQLPERHTSRAPATTRSRHLLRRSCRRQSGSDPIKSSAIAAAIA